MSTRIKVNGLYDSAHLELIKSQGIREFGFDFRPKSFNFLQNYKFIEILEKIYVPNDKYYLVFERETNNVIELFCKDIRNILTQRGSMEQFREQFFLEFYDQREQSFYEALPLKYFLKIDSEMMLKELNGAENLAGLILSFEFLESLQRQNKLFSFFSSLNKKIQTFALPVQLGLDLDWNADLFPSLFEFMQFDFLNLCLSSKVEISYRNVDQAKLMNYISYFKNVKIK